MYRSDLKDSVTKLKGVGKAIANDYKRLGITTCFDLINLKPRAYDDRTQECTLSSLVREEKHELICQIQIISHTYFGQGSKVGQTLKVIAQDREGKRLSLLCFGRNFLERKLYPGSVWYFVGQVMYNNYEWQSSSFEVYNSAEQAGIGRLLPIYPLSGNLTQKIVINNISTILSEHRFEDELPEEIRTKFHLFSTDRALRQLHFPTSTELQKVAYKTLAFTELFYLQLEIRRNLKPNTNRYTDVKPSRLEQKLISALPFSLTESQQKVIKEIRSDLKNGDMNRLLEGDVGAGKTLVAWLSSLYAIEQGGQVAFMAPTELLARQHAENAAKLLEPLGIRLAFITGDVKGKGRNLLLEALKKGEIDIAIGTHALFSKDVHFKNLSYIIIDEQHRFGVEQRDALLEKAKRPNLLMMSATPIPRSLALTLYSDAAISTIDTLPSGRKPIITYLVKDSNRSKMYTSVGVEFKRGHQAYFVYPKIGDEEGNDYGNTELRDVYQMAEFLKEQYPGVPAALIHSKLPEEEKQQILKDFRDKKLMYLVSTSVIEVGIDVPDATCMVIEHADHFGLAALHQLRGRVGRSSLQSYCFLVFGENVTEDAGKRLRCMKENTDGFYIAEQDLAIRGPGDISGLEQSGFLRLNFASIVNDANILKYASIEAKRLFMEDPGLIKGENAMVRHYFATLQG